jgi:hypothetical protein
MEETWLLGMEATLPFGLEMEATWPLGMEATLLLGMEIP